MNQVILLSKAASGSSFLRRLVLVIILTGWSVPSIPTAEIPEWALGEHSAAIRQWADPPDWLRNGIPYLPKPTFGNYALLLQDGLGVSKNPLRTQVLEINLRRHPDGSIDDEVWANCWHRNRAESQGAVLKQWHDGDGWHFEITLDIAGDSYVKGGIGWYQIDVAETNPSGTYRGVFNDVPLHGAVVAMAGVEPPRFAPALAPGVHPRLLLRADRLEAARAWGRSTTGAKIVRMVAENVQPFLAIPFNPKEHGQGYTNDLALSKLTAIAMVWQITQDPVYADYLRSAFAIICDPQGPFKISDYQRLDPYPFDLAWDLLDADQRAKVTAWLTENWVTAGMQKGNGICFSNHSIWEWAADLVQLHALDGTVGKPPADSFPPARGAFQVQAITQARTDITTYQAGTEVSLDDFRCAGPLIAADFTPWSDARHLDRLQFDLPAMGRLAEPPPLALAGSASLAWNKCLAHPGIVELRKNVLETMEMIKTSGGKNVDQIMAAYDQHLFDLGPLLGPNGSVAIAAGPVLVSKGDYRLGLAESYRLRIGDGWLQNGDIIRLPDGVVALALIAWKPAKSGASTSAKLRFEPLEGISLEDALAVRRGRAELVQKRQTWWEQSGREDWSLRNSRIINERNFWRGLEFVLGAGGFNLEGSGYTTSGTWNVSRSLHALRNVSGLAYDQVSHFRFKAMNKLGGGWQFTVGTGSMGPDLCLMDLPFSDPGIQSALKPLFASRFATFNTNPPAKSWSVYGFGGISSILNGLAGWELPFADQPERLAQLPNFVHDGVMGGMILRSGWRQDDCSTILMAKRQLPNSAWQFQDAGAFRIDGLGVCWTSHSHRYKRAFGRDDENVLLVEGIDGAIWQGRTSDVQVDRQGNGQVEIDLLAWNRERMQPYPGPIPTRMLRRVATDYSGKCGAPGLVVIHDQVVGGGRRTWQMHTQDEKSDLYTGYSQEIGFGPGSFTIDGGEGRRLQGIIVEPKGTQPRLGAKRPRVVGDEAARGRLENPKKKKKAGPTKPQDPLNLSNPPEQADTSPFKMVIDPNSVEDKNPEKDTIDKSRRIEVPIDAKDQDVTAILVISREKPLEIKELPATATHRRWRVGDRIVLVSDGDIRFESP